MFSITNSALAKLAAILESDTEVRPKNSCFRLIVDRDGDLALTVDVPKSNDREFLHAGSPVLVMAENLVGNHRDRTLDVNAAGDFVLR